MSDEIVVRVHSYGPGRCLALVYIDPVSGRKRAKSSGTTDWREGERLASELEKELRAGQYVSPSRITWSDFRTKYETERLATLRGEKMKESTLACYLRTIKGALRWAKRMGLLVTVPTFDMPKSGEAKGRPIALEEFERMLAAVPKVRPRDAAAWERIITGFWLCGLRLNEGFILSWEVDAPFAVDLSGRYPAFRIEAKAQKGRRDERLPMTPDFAEWLLQTPEAKRVRTPVLQRLMRHRSINTTLKYYVSLEADDVAADLWANHPAPGNTSGNKSEELAVFPAE